MYFNQELTKLKVAFNSFPENPLHFFLTVHAVTPDDDLWAVTAVGGLARRMTKLLPPTPRRPAPSGTNAGGDDVDDEWELL